MAVQLAQTSCGKTLTFDLGTKGEHVLEPFSQGREIADAALKELASHGLYWRTTTIRLCSMSSLYLERSSSFAEISWRFSAYDSCSLWASHRDHSFEVRTRWRPFFPRVPAAPPPSYYPAYGETQ